MGSEMCIRDRVKSSTPLSVKLPSGQAFWGPLAAFGVACLVVGIAVSFAFFYLGVGVLFVSGLQWTVQAWSDNTTGDSALNANIRNRAVGPLEIPMMAGLGVAVVVIGISRVLLAVSELGAVVLASVASVFIFGSAVLIAKSKAPRQVVSAIVTFGAVAVLAGGIVGAAVGERDFSHEEEGEHSEEEGGKIVEEGEG